MVEKRIDHRFETDVSVISSDNEGLIFGFIRNLSKGGAFIEMKKTLPVGLPFSFTLAHENLQTKVFGRIVRVDHTPQGQPQGIAIQFANVQGHSKFVRDDLLLYAMTRKYMDIWDEKNNAVNE